MLATLPRAIRGKILDIDAIEGVIRGYVAIWTNPNDLDAYGTYFSRENPPEMALDFLPRPISYDHAQDGIVGKEIIGSVDRIWFDDIGIAFEGHLDRSNVYFNRMAEQINAKELFTSSSTAEHTAEFADDGRFITWWLHELALTEHPAEDDIPAVALVRSEPLRDVAETQTDVTLSNDDETPTKGKREMDFANMSLEEIITWLLQNYSSEEVAAAVAQLQAPAMEGEVLSAPDGLTPAPITPVTPVAAPAASGTPDLQIAANKDSLLQLIEALGQRSAPRPQPAANLVDVNALAQAITRAQMSAPPAPQPRIAPQPRQPAQLKGDFGLERKYHTRSLSDLMFVYQVLKARGQAPSGGLIRAMAGRMEDALEVKDVAVYNPSVRRLIHATRADEIVTSTNTGNGDEWVGVAYSGTLWPKVRNNRILDMLVSKGMRVEEVADGYESVIIYTEGSDPTAYTITQSANLDATGRSTVVVPVTAPGTGQVTLTPGYLGLAVAYTSVVEEDMLINASSQLNMQMQEKAEETGEQLFFNGDTATTLNVNSDGATDNTASYYKASNGARKYALVTGSGTSRDGGALTADDFRLTLKLLPSAIRARKKNIAFVVDSDLYNTTLSLPETKTDDVRVKGGTVTLGDLDGIFGIDLMESGFIPLADSDGKVTDGGNVVDRGSLLGIYAPYWAMGWKRHVTFETDKDILAQTSLIVCTFRLGFIPRGAGAAVESYNLTIA